MPEVEQSLIEWRVVQTWMDERGLSSGAIEDIKRIGGGTQNLMFSFRRGESAYVLRRGPEHLRQHTNDALRREAQVLAALTSTDVPIPPLVAAEPDDAVLGSVFYLMEPVGGFNPSVGLPALHAGDAQLRRRMGFAAVDALAKLGSVEPSAVGLGTVGHPEGFLERQVPQWLAQLDKYATYDGYPGHELQHIDSVGRWLVEHQPAGFRPGIMHGDFHLANLMYRNNSAEVAAIVDWEMCTVADPLLDLGWLLATWPVGEVTIGADTLRSAGGLPTRAELVEHYAKVADRGVDHARWYAVMASFKLGIVLEGTNARARAGKAPEAVGNILHGLAIALLNQAAAFIEEGLA